jgi:hypothetical protein
MQGRYWPLEIWALRQASWRDASENAEQLAEVLRAVDLAQAAPASVLADHLGGSPTALLSALERLAVFSACFDRGVEVASARAAELRTVADADHLLLTPRRRQRPAHDG